MGNSGSPDQDSLQKGTFDIAVICTGNQFRSPLVEGLLRTLCLSVPVRVTSLGTARLGPARAVPEAIAIATELGFDLSEHRARCVFEFDLSDADLVIGFEALHVATAVVEAHARPGVTFTLIEIVDLLERIERPRGAGPVDRARQAVALAHSARVHTGLPPTELQISDPLGGSAENYRAVAAQLHTLSARLVDSLFGYAPEHALRAGAVPRD